jgi:hypothetical protein
MVMKRKGGMGRMKARIDKNGYLSLTRNGKYREQTCPYQNPSLWCGDWCPKFGTHVDHMNALSEKRTQIETCSGGLYLESVVDERERGTD